MRFAGRGDFVDQRFLRARQIEERARTRFSGKNLFLAEEEQRHIGATGGRSSAAANPSRPVSRLLLSPGA